MALARLQGYRSWRSDECGQGTVEFAVAMPAVLALAAVSLAVMVYLGDCAAFDRVFRQAVRTYAASSPYGQTVEQSCSQVAVAIQDALGREGVTIEVGCEGANGDKIAFVGTMASEPTFFGYRLDQAFLGLKLPSVSHTNRFVIDRYKPGVVL